jgi:hypothetical protein
MQQKQLHLLNPVLPNLIGGLGNQLFIASAAYVVGKLHNSPVYLCNESDNAHNISKQDYRDSVLKEFGIKLNSKLSSIKCLGINEYWHNDFMPWDPREISVPVILRGYYQHITHIEMFEDEIRAMVLKGIENYRANLRLLCKDIDFKETAFIHVRRGDYVAKADFHFLQPIEYYEKAISLVKSKKPVKKFLIFSDDPDWVSKSPFFKGLEGAIVVNEPDEIKSLALMSLCEAGAICANSTFSWWAAFLCAPGTPICVPQKWINAYVFHLFPEGWNIIALDN